MNKATGISDGMVTVPLDNNNTNVDDMNDKESQRQSSAENETKHTTDSTTTAEGCSDREHTTSSHGHDDNNNKSNNNISPKTSSTTAPLPQTFSHKWTQFIRTRTRGPIIQVMRHLTQHAAHHPWSYIVVIIVFSLVLVVLGALTNFHIDTNTNSLYTPKGTRPLKHYAWIDKHSGFPKDPRGFLLLVHANGGNVVTKEGVQRLFEAVDAVRTTDGYDELCSVKQVTYVDPATGTRTCPVTAVTRFWNESVTIYKSQVQTDQQAAVAMSSSTYADGTPVDIEGVIGRPIFGSDKILTFGQSLDVEIDLPDVTGAPDLEKKAMDRISAMRDAWAKESGNPYRLEYFTSRSFSDEFGRGIAKDTLLIPIVFILIVLFTCFVYSKKDAVKSRALLGFGAVVTVVLALLTGYGLCFVIGVPFTSFTQILPFIIFGVGLDEAFIIMGEFSLKDPTKDVYVRIDETIEAIGVSIFLTSLTNALAFAFSATSSIPTVYNLAFYALPTIGCVLLYELTFFIALLVVDERRIQDNRRDCLVCCHAKSTDNEDEVVAAEITETNQPVKKQRLEARIMGWYADQLLKPWVRVTILLAFLGLFGLQIYSSSLSTQEFKFTETVPKGSYVTAYWNDYKAYSNRGGSVTHAYFRYVDQSDPNIQKQMLQFIDDLVAIPAISDPPTFFWLRDFLAFDSQNNATLQGKTFAEKLDVFLTPDSVYETLYRDDIIRDSNGNIEASRVRLYMDKVDNDSVQDQINALKDQDRVSQNEPINKGKRDWDFFTFDQMYFIWQFYSVAVHELIVNTVESIAAVTIVAMLLIPHWTAVVFIFPTVLITYVDMLGSLRFAGVHINVVSHIAMVISIGLIVDYLMYVLIRYYESKEITRTGKVKDMLESMGASILVGAFAMFLGVLPMAFSSSTVFRTIFVSFISLITIGAGHGLIFLPVVLSLWGPTDILPEESKREKSEPKQLSEDEECQ